MASNDPETFKSLLGKLVKTPEFFSPDDLRLALNFIFTPEAVQPVQLGSFLTALHIEHLERRPEYLAAAADVLRERALKAVVEDADKDFVVDIVGTGGDGHDTFNVSTTAAVVAAGAGARVIKVCSRTLHLKTMTVNECYSTEVALPLPPRVLQTYCSRWDVCSQRPHQIPPRCYRAYPLRSSSRPTITLPWP